MGILPHGRRESSLLRESDFTRLKVGCPLCVTGPYGVLSRLFSPCFNPASGCFTVRPKIAQSKHFIPSFMCPFFLTDDARGATVSNSVDFPPRLLFFYRTSLKNVGDSGGSWAFGREVLPGFAFALTLFFFWGVLCSFQVMFHVFMFVNILVICLGLLFCVCVFVLVMFYISVCF